MTVLRVDPAFAILLLSTPQALGHTCRAGAAVQGEGLLRLVRSRDSRLTARKRGAPRLRSMASRGWLAPEMIEATPAAWTDPPLKSASPQWPLPASWKRQHDLSSPGNNLYEINKGCRALADGDFWA
jgi:hypothetical protein